MVSVFFGAVQFGLYAVRQDSYGKCMADINVVHNGQIGKLFLVCHDLADYLFIFFIIDFALRFPNDNAADNS